MSEEEKLIKCYCCGMNLLQEKVIEGKLHRVFHPERRITQFYLNNNSRMDVAICMTCKKQDLNDPVVHSIIMQNIIDGWNTEQNILLKRGIITKEQLNKSMNYHKSLNILFKSEAMNDYQIKARISR